MPASLSQLVEYGETPQHGSLYMSSHAQVGVDVNTNHEMTSTITLSTDSAHAGRMCWRGLIAHHMTSVFDEFNLNQFDFIQRQVI